MIYFLFFVSLISMVLLMIFLISNKMLNLDKNKLISFECGFNSFNFPRVPFSIQFFKILLIFLFFDMEIVIILPLVFYKNFSMMLLLVISLIMLVLVVGLFFEMAEGSLEWLN